MNSGKADPLSAIHAAYIAGLIDGEGTIALTRKHRNEYRQLAITISDTDKTLLEYILKLAGSGKITGKRTTRPHHAPSFTYAIYNRQALGLLAEITPYLKTYKARRAKLILDSHLALTPRNGKYNESQRVARRKFEDMVMQIKPR